MSAGIFCARKGEQHMGRGFKFPKRRKWRNGPTRVKRPQDQGWPFWKRLRARAIREVRRLGQRLAREQSSSNSGEPR